MDIAVLGGGNGSYAAAADLAEQGHNVRLWRRNREALAPLLQTPVLTLNDFRGQRQVRLSPAAQVRGANNLIIQPASVYGTFRVGVKTDAQGMVHRIWILSAEEWAALRPGN